jgi:uncharacterized protein (TIGR03083 family)
MSELADRTIAALRTEHDTLVALLVERGDGKLTAPSGAGEWTVAQVLSHLGSGAEIGRAPIARAAGESVPAETNQEIWARWDAAAPADQAAGFVASNARWLETVEALTPEQRSSLKIDMGFLPEPVPLETAVGLRLNEVANHTWDVRVALDPEAEILPESAAALVELLAGPLSFLLGWVAKPAELPGPAALAAPGAGVLIDDGVTVTTTPPAAPTATLTGAQGAVIRLLNGRLKAPFTANVTLEGALTLPDLGRVFPGF